MQIPDLEPDGLEIFGKVLGRALGERGDQHPLAFSGVGADFLHDVINLVGERAYHDGGIHQSCGSDQLRHRRWRYLPFIGTRRGGGEDDGAHAPHELVKVHRAVVLGGRQAEAVLDQHGFPGLVAVIHAPDLGDGDVGFVNDREEITGEVVQQGSGFFTRLASAEVAGIILDTGAEADFLEHFHVIHGAHFDALGFQQFAVGLEPADAILHFGDDRTDGAPDFFLGHDEVCRRRNDHMAQWALDVAAHDIERLGAFQGVAEEVEPDPLGGVGGKDIHRVAPDAEGAGLGSVVVAVVLDIHEFREDLVAVNGVADAGLHDHFFVILGRAEAVDAGDGGHDDHVVAAEQGIGGGEAEPFDLLVDRGVLLDIGVGLGDVGLGLIVVVVADEILDGVLGEKAFQFGVELGGEGLVMGDNKGRTAMAGDDVGYGEGLARPRHPLEDLEAPPVA